MKFLPQHNKLKSASTLITELNTLTFELLNASAKALKKENASLQAK
jgi:hypothetical protein